MEDSLFDQEPEQDAFLKRVSALAAPVARNAGAIIEEASHLEVAKAVFDAFGTLDASGGLTRAELQEACAEVCEEDIFSSRFNLFLELEMLQPLRNKDYQQRYVFNPTSAAGIMVVERLASNGGVDELVTLLDRTRAGLRGQHVTEAQVQEQLRSALRMITISADHLFRMVANDPIAELRAQRRHHNHKDLIDLVRDLVEEVHERFEDLDALAQRLVTQTQRYLDACDEFIGRLLKEGTVAKDFSLLDPEDYFTAAVSSEVDALAEVFAEVVFDPPSLHLDPSVLALALTKHTPRPARHSRLPRPPARIDDHDPMADVEQHAREQKQQRARLIDVLMQGDDEVDLTSQLRSTSWPGAAKLLVRALAIDADPKIPVSLHLSDELIVDPDSPTTRTTPVILRRTTPTDEVLHALEELTGPIVASITEDLNLTRQEARL